MATGFDEGRASSWAGLGDDRATGVAAVDASRSSEPAADRGG